MKTPLVALALMLGLAAPALAQDNPPTLSANGTGSEDASPDIAFITLGVLSHAETAREALDANNEQMDGVIQTVRGEKVADKDIATTGFSIGPVYSQEPQRPDGSHTPPKIVGYQVSNQVRIVVRDLDALGVILDKAVTAGANQAASINFVIENRTELAEKAVVAAITDARHKAELMAEAAGVRLVRVLSVNANENGGPPMPMFEARAMAAADKSVPVMRGEQTVSASASITWEIAPK